VAQALLDEKAAEDADPFSRRDGWRSHGVTVRRFEFEFARVPTAGPELSYLHDGALHLSVEGASGTLQFAATAQGLDVQFAGQRATRAGLCPGRDRPCVCPHGATQILNVDLLAHAGESQRRPGA
jgi:3-methylcrotonyl-CoA carboxylase alpha subunit